VSILDDLVTDNRPGRSFLHHAFIVALDDFAARRNAAPTIKDAATVAGALAVMARLNPERVDPVQLVNAEREETALMMVARCTSYLPLLAENAPTVSPWFVALSEAGPKIDAARDGEPAAAFDPAWIEQLAPTTFRIPAPRRYLERYLDRMLSKLDGEAEVSGALWICLKFRRWFRPSAAQRAVLEAQVAALASSPRYDHMRAALARLEPAVTGDPPTDTGPFPRDPS
jgi:hypothetical protein